MDNAASALLRGTGGSVGVSVVALGEFLRRLIALENEGKFTSEQFESTIRGLQVAVARGNVICLQREADNWQVGKILPRVMQECPEHMQENDGLVVTYAALDKHCNVLYSEDGDMIGSMGFKDFVREEFGVEIRPLQA